VKMFEVAIFAKVQAKSREEAWHRVIEDFSVADMHACARRVIVTDFQGHLDGPDDILVIKDTGEVGGSFTVKLSGCAKCWDWKPSPTSGNARTCTDCGRVV